MDVTGQPRTLRESYFIAVVSLPVLAIYGVAQTGLAVLIDKDQPGLKLMLEPYLLLLGLILHVQWRRVTLTFREHEEPRPWWIAGADCLSFVITIWALSLLVNAFLVQAKLL